jgi:hypothetical protein
MNWTEVMVAIVLGHGAAACADGELADEVLDRDEKAMVGCYTLQCRAARVPAALLRLPARPSYPT